ncbi:D-glycerate dehydrogenase [Tsukamurella sp. 8F]|uniref:2-hydroxyacid dehydrogenase n=1 Tax=unclassified Tsukamurella TaxID=2633480 RepID=UPI0023B9CA55|nr:MULTISPECIES: D-glycerate dehydrogenase [unclassified Tsukamurella]MDF0530438.1 D-glycerate dehydrogenase [Tsukamurella sp. 8J]MDF0587741.1 D-glycerate dehydrogenase [Tsukamurella sp. 8F]
MSDFLVTTELPGDGMRRLAAAGSVRLAERPFGATELAEACRSGDYRVVVAQLADHFDAQLLGDARISGISNYAVGFNNIDIDAATDNSIIVGNTPGVLTDSTADIAMLLILGVARRAVESDAFVRRGAFKGWEPDLLLGHDVTGRRLGMAGFGRIGKATARRALAFGMEVAFCPRPPADRAVTDDELGDLAGRVTHVAWDELVETSDFLSVHVPLAAETRHLVDARVLRRMKPTAILVNTARGPVVDEAALVEALRDGEIAGAGLDVYEDEPRLASGLTEQPNTVLLPHIGSATLAVRAAMSRLCADNAVAMLRGEIPPHPVNPEAWR